MCQGNLRIELSGIDLGLSTIRVEPSTRSGGPDVVVMIVSKVAGADTVGMETGTMGRNGGEAISGLGGAVDREFCLDRSI